MPISKEAKLATLREMQETMNGQRQGLMKVLKTWNDVASRKATPDEVRKAHEDLFLTLRHTAMQCEMWSRLLDHFITSESEGKGETISEGTGARGGLTVDAAGTQHAPEVAGQLLRMETAPLKFGDDWTGLFIRGDDAISFLHALREVTNAATSPTPEMPRLVELMELLEATAK